MNDRFKIIRNYYNSLYKSGDLGYVINRDSWISEYISYIPNGIALELGIGTGKNVDFLLENGFFVEGVDISNVAINRLNAKYIHKKCKFWVDDITQMNIPSKKYSLIICSMVLSHLSEEECVELIKRIKHGLIDGGCVFICTMSKDDPMFFHNAIRTANFGVNSNSIISGLKRTFYDKLQIKNLFDDFDIIELSDVYIKEPNRKTAAGYYGLIMYMGKKYTCSNVYGSVNL